MFENDYVMRMVSMLAMALARLAGLGNGEEPEEIIDETCRELLGIDIGVLTALPWQDLLALTGEGREARARLRVMAHMLRAHSDTAGCADAAYYRIKALTLYAFSLETDEEMEQEFVALLRNCGNGLPACAAERYMLFLFAARELNLAEDIAFFALEDEPDRGLVLALSEFYRNVIKLQDGELEACGFPRDEAEAGLRELEKFGIDSE